MQQNGIFNNDVKNVKYLQDNENFWHKSQVKFVQDM